MYTIEVKTSILNQYQNGAKLKDLAQNNHISKSTIYSWITKEFASEKKQAGLTAKQVYGLKCEQSRLQQFNEIYSTTGITALSPIGDRLLTIDKQSSTSTFSSITVTDRIIN